MLANGDAFILDSIARWATRNGVGLDYKDCRAT
jgi:hypothetical protein